MNDTQDKITAAIEFIRRTGARQIQIRYSDDEQPVIWFVVALYKKKGPGGQSKVAVNADVNPLAAALGLCEKIADGGMCMHCQRPVGFEPRMLNRMPYDNLICWYQWDPEMKTFRRGCEGESR